MCEIKDTTNPRTETCTNQVQHMPSREAAAPNGCTLSSCAGPTQGSSACLFARRAVQALPATLTEGRSLQGMYCSACGVFAQVLQHVMCQSPPAAVLPSRKARQPVSLHVEQYMRCRLRSQRDAACRACTALYAGSLHRC